MRASRPAIKSAFWDYWKTAVFGQILAGSLLEPDFGNLRASRPAIKTAFCDYWETARFGPNPGREPFGARFWQFGGFRAASKNAFWNYWEMTVVGQILAGSRLEPDCGNFAGFWKPLGSFWEASKTPGNGRAPVSSAPRLENTKAQAFFKARVSRSDASSWKPFWVTLEL